jgi:hypothetical protein
MISEFKEEMYMQLNEFKEDTNKQLTELKRIQTNRWMKQNSIAEYETGIRRVVGG